MTADIATCPRCRGGGMVSMGRGKGGAFCPNCLGTGQRHTLSECDECAVPLLVPWSVDHTLAPLRCDSCAAVVNNVETARYAGEKGEVARWAGTGAKNARRWSRR